MKRKRKLLGASGWSWDWQGRLVRWAEPTRKQLVRKGRPSPEAVPVRVRIVPVAELRKAMKAKEKT